MRQIDKRALQVSVLALIAMSVTRMIHFSLTGLLVSDEGLYLLSGILSAERQTIVIAYPNRLLYQLVFAVSGFLLKLDNVYKVTYFALAFNLVCSIASVLLSYKIVADFLPKHSQYAFIYVLVLPTLIMFVVSTVAILAESMCFMFLLAGVYFLFKAIHRKSVFYAGLSGLLLGMPYFTREPYAVISIVFLVAAFPLTLKGHLNKKQLVLFSLFLLLFFRVPGFYRKINLSNYLVVEAARLFDPSIGIQIPLPQDMHTTTFVPTNSSMIYQYEQEPNEMYVSSEYGTSMEWSTMIPTLQKISYTLYLTVFGMAFGWNPVVFALTVAAFIYLLFRREEASIYERILYVVAFSSVLVFAGSNYLAGTVEAEQAATGITVPYGTIIRMSHPSIPATFSVLPVLKHVEPWFHRKRFYAVLGLVGLLCAGTLVYTVNTFQVQWSAGYIDRTSFAYRSPYVRVHDYCQTSGRTLLFGGANIVQLSLFLRNMNNIFISRPPKNEADMAFLLKQEDWTTILIYGITHWTADPALEERFPYFWSMIQNQTDYKCNVVFEDGESYLFKLEVT